MKRFNLKLTDKQHKWLRQKAFKKEKSMATIIRELLEKDNEGLCRGSIGFDN